MVLRDIWAEGKLRGRGVQAGFATDVVMLSCYMYIVTSALRVA